jgi:hypothetical protein
MTASGANGEPANPHRTNGHGSGDEETEAPGPAGHRRSLSQLLRSAAGHLRKA